MTGITEIDEKIQSIKDEIINIKEAMEFIGIEFNDETPSQYPTMLEAFYYPNTEDRHLEPIEDDNTTYTDWNNKLEKFKNDFKDLFQRIGITVDVDFLHYHELILQLKKKVNMNISVNSTSTVWGSNITITISLKDSDNQPINGARNYITCNNNIVFKTENNGIYTFSTTQNTPNTYNYIFSYDGGSNYQKITSTPIQLTFKKRDLILTYNTASTIYQNHQIRYKVIDKTTNSAPTGLTAVLNINGSKSTVNINNGQFISSKITGTDGKEFSSTCTIQSNSYYNIPSLPTKTSTYKQYATKAILASSITRESKPNTPTVTNISNCQKKGVTWAQWFVGKDNLNDHRTAFTYSNTSTIAKCWLAGKNGSTVNKTPSKITGKFNPSIPNGTIYDIKFYINDKRDSTTTIGKPTLTTGGKTYTFSSAPGTSYGRNYISLKSLYNSVSKVNDGITVKLSYPANSQADCGYLYLTSFVLYVYYIPNQV